VLEIGPTTVRLGWTSPGDDSLLGIASEYDIRYDTLAITDGNFLSAVDATSEPEPAPSGSQEEFIVSGLTPGRRYYFALKSFDEVPNESPISNVPEAITTEDPNVFVDDFNREYIGNRWVANDEVMIEENELAYNYNSEMLPWSIRAIYGYAWNPGSVMLRYGKNNSQVENGSVGILLMMNSLSLTDTRGYMIRYFYSEYHLYEYDNSMLVEIGTPIPEPNPPSAGDLLRVVQYSAGNENRFDIYHDEILKGTLVDPDGLFNPPTYYVGVVFENEVSSRVSEIDNFTVADATGNSAPSIFSLIWPSNGDTLGEDIIDFIWHESIDDDPHSKVEYEFYLDVDSLFPEGARAKDLVDTVYTFTEPLANGNVYYWKVVAHDEFEDSTQSQKIFSIYFDNGSGIYWDQPFASGLPRIANLLQNFPNPFNPVTVIKYDVPLGSNGDAEEEIPVTLRVYDSRGKLVKTLKKGSDRPGRYSVAWGGKDERGRVVASGVYIYSILIGEKRLTRKMLLLR
ncbi:MAG: FlgD immunoglobulin-like domain containing protein, partial [Candidatus Glassbacteria bacterium]